MTLGRIIPLIVAFAAVALGGYALLRGKFQAPDAMIGRIPETLNLQSLTLDGPQPATPFAPKGPVIVNFWASWCTPCRIEQPVVIDLAKESGVPVVGVVYRDTPEAAAGFLAETANPYSEVRLDPEGQAGSNFGIKGVPETFVLAPDGKIIARISGPLSSQNVQKTIAPALRSAGAIRKN